jgi:hypothetical protein
MNLDGFPPAIADLLREERLNPLGPGCPNKAARTRLQALTPATTFAPHTLRDPEMAKACLAGLWLYHDFLDESHTLSQDIATPTGSYWHGIMHRREPDPSNAAYWFRRVGNHPVFEPLQKAAAELAIAQPNPAARFLATQARWDPFAFIDLCAAVQAVETAPEALCQEIQAREWQLLFDFCYRRALGHDR